MSSLDSPSNKTPKKPDAIPSKNLLGLSLLSTLFYGVIAFLIFRYFHDTTLDQAFKHGTELFSQLAVGNILGIMSALIIYFLIQQSPIRQTLSDFYIFDAISKLRFNQFDRIQVSAFAGVGEELLFRGAIQPLLGNVITSFIFVGIHGYFKFKSVGHILFGLSMLGLSLMLGLLYEYIGLVAAMTAHAIYDMVMLQLVQQRNFH